MEAARALLEDIGKLDTLRSSCGICGFQLAIPGFGSRRRTHLVPTLVQLMLLLKFAANRTPCLGWIIPVICGCPIRFQYPFRSFPSSQRCCRLGVPSKLASATAGYFCDYRTVLLSEVMPGISIFFFFHFYALWINLHKNCYFYFWNLFGHCRS